MRQVIIPAVAEHTIDEDVTSITIDSTMKSISIILTQYKDGNKIGHKHVNLGHEGYALLMETESPDWAEGKPIGSFRREDIFTVMDVMGIS
jgi:hypothetical protein